MSGKRRRVQHGAAVATVINDEASGEISIDFADEWAEPTRVITDEQLRALRKQCTSVLGMELP